MKKISAIIITILVLFAMESTIFAFDPYHGYIYDEFGRPVPSVSGFSPYRTVYSDSSGEYDFDSIDDIHIDKYGNIFILDGKRGEIILLDNNYEILKVYSDFKDANGMLYDLNNPESLFVSDALIYIADSDNLRVLVMDMEGVILNNIGKPEDEIFPQNRDFRPSKVIADSVGNIYVIVSGVFQGAATFDRNGEFIEFFGSARVELSARLLRDFLWRRFVTEEMRQRLARYVPVEFTSFDIDEDNFIYSVSSRTSRTGQIRKINPAGVNIWNPLVNYGDIEFSMRRGRMIDTYFADVTVNDEGFVFALDSSRNRIFVYDNEGDFVFAFAGRGNQKGTFLEPRIIDSFGEKIYVYDSGKNSITEFMPNEYGEIVLDAILMFQDGRYVESKEMWEEVLRRNSNNYTAYIGIGKALYHTGNYGEAMKYHQLGGAKAQESVAFEKYRALFIRENFTYFAFSLLLIFLAATGINKRKVIVEFYKARRNKA